MKREKQIKDKVIAICTALCALIAIFSALSDMLLSLYLYNRFNINAKNAGSTGIIGGADGPTAVFISGEISSDWFTAVFAFLAVLGIIYLVINKYKKIHN